MEKNLESYNVSNMIKQSNMVKSFVSMDRLTSHSWIMFFFEPPRPELQAALKSRMDRKGVTKRRPADGSTAKSRG